MFLRKANLSAEKQSQIASAAMSRYEYEPLRDAMLTEIPRTGALRGSVPCIENSPERTLPKWWRPRMKRTKGSRSSTKNEASDDELEVEYQEAAAIMTIAKQRRAEVDRARQFFRKPSHLKIARPELTS